MTIVNLRDLAESSNKIKPHFFYRSHELTNISDEDRNYLEKIGIKKIYDLRGPNEYLNRPDEVAENNFKIYHFDVSKDSIAPTAEMLKDKDTVSGSKIIMEQAYHEMVLKESGRNSFKEIILDILNQPDETILFHCWGGKDRTGLLAALIYTLVGADESEIMNDYLKTNQQNPAAYRVAFGDQGSFNELSELEQTQWSAFPEYLISTKDLIVNQFGSINQYLLDHDGLSLSKEEIKDFENKFSR